MIGKRSKRQRETNKVSAPLKYTLYALIPVALMISFVVFANPQMNRWIYALQAYGFEYDGSPRPEQMNVDSCQYGCKHNRFLKPPDDFSGLWEIYCDYGHPIVAGEFKNGRFVKVVGHEHLEIKGYDYGIMFDNWVYGTSRETFHK